MKIAVIGACRNSVTRELMRVGESAVSCSYWMIKSPKTGNYIYVYKTRCREQFPLLDVKFREGCDKHNKKFSNKPCSEGCEKGHFMECDLSVEDMKNLFEIREMNV